MHTIYGNQALSPPAFGRIPPSTGILQVQSALSLWLLPLGRTRSANRLNQMAKRKIFLATFFLILVATLTGRAQQESEPGNDSQAADTPDAEFLQAADEVLADMSKILFLPIKEPLKKSVRSREEVRQYLIRQMREDKDDTKRYADQKALEALGLIPKDYPLDQKMIALLTEQIAGLYDPKGREFFIADWTQPAEQRMIMAHELTHALQDQYFHVQKWEDEVKQNDDAQLARESVLEGSATIAMIDYLLRNTGKSSRDITDFDPSLLLGDANDSPELADAPMVIQDELTFPYLPGASFVQRALKTWNGWRDMHRMFEKPPASTQQILHPDLYFRGVMPVPVDLSPVAKVVPRGWKKLDENVLGEFGLNEVLKQFIGKDRAHEVAPSWAGDRYAIYQRESGAQTLLLIRLKLSDEPAATRFFGAYLRLLEEKDGKRTAVARRQNFYSFNTPDGGVFLRCYKDECLIAEGATVDVFDAMTRAIRWPDAPPAPPESDEPGVTVMRRTPTPRTQRPFGMILRRSAPQRRSYLILPIAKPLRGDSTQESIMTWLDLPRVPEPEVMDDSNEVRAYSSASAEAYLSTVDDSFVEHALRLIGSASGWAIDLGCGPGQIVRKLSVRLPQWKFVGVDRSQTMIRGAVETRHSRGGLAIWKPLVPGPKLASSWAMPTPFRSRRELRSHPVQFGVTPHR